MKTFTVLASLCVAACAAVPPPKAETTQAMAPSGESHLITTAVHEEDIVPSAVPFTPEATQGGIGIELAGKMTAFIFFTGARKVYGADECSLDPKCVAMLAALSRLHRLEKIEFTKGAPEENEESAPDQSHALPHRMSWELDPQSSPRDTGTAEGCRRSGGIVNYVPESGVYLNCYSATR